MLHGEMEDELFSLLVLNSKSEKKKKGSLLSYLVYAASILLALAAAAGAYLYYSTDAGVIDPGNASGNRTTAETPAKQTRLEREGYTKIGSIIFVGDNKSTEGAALESGFQDENAVKRPEKPFVKLKPLEVDKEPPRKKSIPGGNYVKAGRERPAVKEKPARSRPDQSRTAQNSSEKAKSAPVSGNYRIRFENIGGSDFEGLKGKISSAGMRYNVVSSYTKTDTVWSLYRLSPGSKTVIAGRGVEFVKSFTSKEDAILYAKSNSIPALIKTSESKANFRTVDVCCTTVERAKKFGLNSGINTEKIKIIRSQGKKN